MADVEMRRRVSKARVGRLATVGSDGRPHVVPVCFALDGDRVVSAVDHKPKRTTALRRLDNVRERPFASLLVDHYEDDWDRLWWVRVDGPATVVGPEDDAHRHAVDRLVAKYPQYRERRPGGPVIVIAATRWRAWSAR